MTKSSAAVGFALMLGFLLGAGFGTGCAPERPTVELPCRMIEHP